MKTFVVVIVLFCFFFLLRITLGSLPPLVKPELLQPEPCKSPVNQSNHPENAKEYFDHNIQHSPDLTTVNMNLPFQRSWLAPEFRDSVIAHTYREGPKASEEEEEEAAAAAATAAAAVGLWSLGWAAVSVVLNFEYSPHFWGEES